MRCVLVGVVVAALAALGTSLASAQEQVVQSPTERQHRQIPDRAKQESESAIDGEPESATTCAERGRSLFLNGDVDGALREYNKAIAREPQEKGNPGFKNLFAGIYAKRAIIFSWLGDHKSAIGDFDRSLQLEPRSAKVLCFRSDEYCRLARTAEARRDLVEAVRVDPRFSRGYRKLSMLLREQGDLDKAIEQLTEGLRQCGDEKSLLMGRAKLLLAKQDYRAAIPDLSKGIELDPKDVDAYLKRAEAFEAIGDVTRAATDLDRAVEIGKDDRLASTGALFRRACFFQWHGKPAKALTDFNELIRCDPRNTFSFLQRARVYEALGDIDRAAADFDRAAELAERDPTFSSERQFLKRERALFFQKHGLADRALAEFTAAIRANPNSYECYVNRAMFFSEQGRDRDAIADLSKAIEIDPTQETAFSMRAAAWLRTQQPARALEDITQAIVLGPADPLSYLARAELLQTLGRPEEANADVRRAKELAGIKDSESSKKLPNVRAIAP